MPDAVLRSLLSLGVRALLKPVLRPGVPFVAQRTWVELASRTAPLPSDVHVSSERLGDVAAERLRPVTVRADTALLYLHGGGYCVGSPRSHRALGAWLARAAGSATYVPDYRLAPDHPFPAALDDALAAYAGLRTRGYAADRIALAGDSAGGGLALALAGALRERGEPQPAAIVLFSPWLDLTLSGATLATHARLDPLVSPAWLRRCAGAYAGGVPVSDPRLSPLFMDVAALPPLAVHTALREVLLDDAARFVERVRAAGGSIAYRRDPRLWHDAELHAGLLPSARAALGDAATFLQRQWRTAAAS